MRVLFVWVSAEGVILGAFRDPEVVCATYLDSECSSQHLVDVAREELGDLGLC